MKKENYKFWERKIIKEINKLWERSDKFLPCHGPTHHIRVWKMAEKFGLKKKADLEILVACCLLHDIVAFNKTPIKNHDVASAKIAKKILKEIKYPPEKINIVYQAISSHTSIKKQLGGLEGKIMSSFDKVDAFGAIGVYRIITPMTIRGYNIDTIVRWFGTGKKLQSKWDSIEFSEIQREYRKDYLYTVDFFKNLVKYN
ncbi:HD domain-containing protein [Patescibacteria group bacterium]|nr:HD domain-containing protein [Patescibacteria group bacterium]